MAYAQDPTFGSTPQAPIAVIPVTTGGIPSGGPYYKAVTLTPGTPVSPGRGALVTGSGTFGLKLAGGGVIRAYDPTGGAGTRVDGYAVVDADLTNAGAGASVQVLY